MPKSRTNYWPEKLARNVTRDARVRAKLRRLGWKVMVVWECQTKNPDQITRRLQRFLKRGS
jgi:DNA mismatch endonuclease (patch repair protein)